MKTSAQLQKKQAYLHIYGLGFSLTLRYQLIFKCETNIPGAEAHHSDCLWKKQQCRYYHRILKSVHTATQYFF
jgi:hypothetical protein